MGTKVRFTKMHGAGNDYIYVDTALYDIADPCTAAAVWSDRHKGIGADGLVLIGRSPMPDADFSMRIFNADGSEAMMCGNALRCIGKYLFEKGITTATRFKVLTLSGIKTLTLHLAGSSRMDAGLVVHRQVESVTVDMQMPILKNRTQLAAGDGEMLDGIVTVSGQEFRGTFVSMGNPHFVIFTDHVGQIDIDKCGPMLEQHVCFPQRCNIEFAQVLADGSIRTRVWERGSGITMACGTGACATAVAAALTGRASRTSTIIMDGGTLQVEWRESDRHVYLTGPAAFVFEGEVELPGKDGAADTARAAGETVSRTETQNI
ncbi:MAG: diaminopimelate epimerase [Bacteroidales bacterium]|nr:diaminopimelate epimerase [Bacteroidales bacterium]